MTKTNTMTPIEYLYAYIRDVQKRHEEGSPRWNPWLAAVLIVAPVIHAFARICLPAMGRWDERLGTGFLGAASPLYWASVLFAGILGVLLLDRRRAAIDLSYSAIAAPITATAKFIVFVVFLALGFGLTGLSWRAPGTCVLVFMGSYLLGLALIKRRATRALRQEP